MHEAVWKWLAHLGAFLGGFAVTVVLGFIGAPLIFGGGGTNLVVIVWSLAAFWLLVQVALLVAVHGWLFEVLSGDLRDEGWFWGRFGTVLAVAFLSGLLGYWGLIGPLGAVALAYVVIFFGGGFLLIHLKGAEAL
ncbi:hypothetical protein BXY66_0934 [Shimia isoporae]|uniref:Uncharacterized protein n=1 Tax=Shimia isoporae TaxID=647720 RepID=A0A4R1NQC3_9RHOB|nr:hypothetical protein [Shimia isoporae]TCL08893.1 hypothetical protein BXY66_0934 [Shimia isoporae]